MTARVNIENIGQQTVKLYGADQKVSMLAPGAAVEFDIHDGHEFRGLAVKAEDKPETKAEDGGE